MTSSITLELNELYDRISEDMTEGQKKIFASITENILRSRFNGEEGALLPDEYMLHPDGSIHIRDGKGIGHPVGIEGLFSLINSILQISAQNRDLSWLKEDSDGTKKFPFVRYGNENEYQYPCVSYKVVHGLPGAFGTGRENAPTARQRRESLREIARDPINPADLIHIMGAREDYHIQLCISAYTPEEADSISKWVKNTINNNIWYLKTSGIVNFFFSERYADTYREVEGKSIHERQLKYYVAVDNLYWERVSTLKQLCLAVNIG